MFSEATPLYMKPDSAFYQTISPPLQASTLINQYFGLSYSLVIY